MVKRMRKRFIIFFITLFIIVNQYPAWCVEQTTALKFSNRQAIYTIEKNIFQEKLKPYQFVSNMENDFQSEPWRSNENSLLWLTSIIIPGLGQVLMGNILRGLTFTAIITVLIFLLGISRAVNLTFFLGTIVTGNPSAHLFDFVEIFIWISIAIIHIWNIFDAISLSKELSEPDNNLDTEMAELQIIESGNYRSNHQGY